MVGSSDAEAKGVLAGDRLVRVDGMPLASAGLSFTFVALIADAVSTQRTFEFERDGGTRLVQIAAEDLLPPLP